MNRHRQGKGCRLRPRPDLALQCWRFEGRIKTNRHSNAVLLLYWADRLRGDELTFPQRWKSWRVVHTLSSGSGDSHHAKLFGAASSLPVKRRCA